MPVEKFPPAPGQGAICIETRSGDEKTRALLEPISHVPTTAALVCERAFLAEPDGSRLRRAERRVSWPETEALAEKVGAELGRELRR